MAWLEAKACYEAPLRAGGFDMSSPPVALTPGAPEFDGTLRASARSLSMAARFAERLAELLGEPLEVAQAEWRDLREGRGAL